MGTRCPVALATVGGMRVRHQPTHSPVVASLSLRVGANLFDSAIALLLVAATFSLAHGWAAAAFVAAGVFAYQVVMVGVCGQTLGKMVFGTRVVEAIGLGPPQWQQAFIRALVPTAAGLLGFLLFPLL